MLFPAPATEMTEELMVIETEWTEGAYDCQESTIENRSLSILEMYCLE
jgi:hypothetical protein